ncbi:MAG: CRISPR-associated protein [Bacteroidales bacterium]|nr:CRISPR-associated protein [Bacteroidales bacterium]
MLLNLSNHPSTSWSEPQLAAAGGNVVDLAFPQVAPDGDEAYIEQLANDYYNKINAMPNIEAVHIMGEMNFTYSLVSKLKAHNIRCVASTTKRETVEENGVKISKFNFVRFREY